MQAFALLGALSAVTLTSLGRPSCGAAQWSASVEVGAERFWGGSIENAPERRSFRPYRPTTFGAGLERRSGDWGMGLAVRYTEASLGLEGSDAIAAVKGVFRVYGISPGASYRVASVGSGNELTLRGGPLIEFWSISGEDSRSRIGIHAAASLSIPLGRRFTGSVSAGGALSPSPFEPDELSGYELRALWRRRLAAGLQYRL